MLLLLGLIIPLASFILQSYPRFFNRYFGVDVWTRLTEADLIRKNSHKIPGRISKRFIIDGYFDYPPLFPWLLSFIPKDTLKAYQGLVAPVFDAIHCIFVYLIALHLTQNISVALLSQLIYMLTPLVALENSYLTPRSFGYLNFTLAFYPMIIYVATGNSVFLLFSLISTVLIFLTHRFATQSLLFLTILFSFLHLTPVYIGIYVSSFIIAVLLTRGYYLRVLKGHLSNIYFWVGTYHYRFAHQIRGLKKTQHKTDFISLVYFFLEKLSPLGLLGTNTWILSAFFIALFPSRINTLLVIPNIQLTLSMWVISCYVLAIVVLSWKKLIPIGEGQRYVEMATAPTAILSSILFFSFLTTSFAPYAIGILICLLLVNIVIILYTQRSVVLKDKNRTLTKDLMDMYTYINTLPKTPRIICIPHQITTMTLYNTKADILVNADNPGLLRITDIYPILTTSLENLKKRYNLNYLLLRESFATIGELKATKYPLVKKFGDIVLLKLQ